MKSKQYFLIILLSLFFSVYKNVKAQSPNWLWANSAGGSNNDYAQHSVTDANGNSFVSGYFHSDSITFGNTTLINNMTDGSSDIFLVKYNDAGNVVWAKSAGGNNWDVVNANAADNNGNSYITGYFSSDSITFDSITFYSSGTGYGNYILVKYDTAGNVIWATNTDGGNGMSVASDVNGNCYVTGRFQSPSITFGSTVLTQTGLGDIFTVKYDSGGNVVWAKSGGGNNSDFCNSISADGNGNSYVTGGFRSTSISFDSVTLINAGGICPYCVDVFLVKYDSAGNVVWAKSTGGTNVDNGVSNASDVNGNCYVTGYFVSDSITFGNTTLIKNAADSTNDIYIVKYDTGGNVVWAKSAGSDSADNSTAIALDANGNCYLTGYFMGNSITFGSTTLINTNTGTADIFVARYDSSGNIVWAKSAGGNNTDIGESIGIDANGSGYVMGWYRSASIVFGSTSLLNTDTSYADIYLAKFDIVTGTISVNNKNDITVFPNPSNGVINISFGGTVGKGKVQILNILGEVAFEESIFNDSSKEINLQGISNGIYLVKMYDGEKYHCKKIIIDSN